MDVFYNLQAIGDVLVIPIKEGNRYELKNEKLGDITRIVDGDNEVLGYNIFNASKHFNLEKSGKITLSESFLKEIKSLFTKQGLSDSLDFDLSPKFVVGYVLEKSPHQDADKLSVCLVDVGNETLQIVCGAANVAKVGATMPSGLKIEPTELRGVPSNGMICSRKELNMPVKEDKQGIYILEDSFVTGSPFTF